jgi:hypothetical protein
MRFCNQTARGDPGDLSIEVKFCDSRTLQCLLAAKHLLGNEQRLIHCPIDTPPGEKFGRHDEYSFARLEARTSYEVLKLKCAYNGDFHASPRTKRIIKN